MDKWLKHLKGERRVLHGKYWFYVSLYRFDTLINPRSAIKLVILMREMTKTFKSESQKYL